MNSDSSASGRQAVVNRVLADPPVVHFMSYDDMDRGQLTGVFATDESCYRFMANRCPPGARTLETGCGLSTILFAAWGARHWCVAPGQVEIDAVEQYCDAHSIDRELLTFVVEPSDRGLPGLLDEEDELDLVLIDGSHGFPTPIIDWYYGAGHLRQGGTVVVDDLQLPAVMDLDRFLVADPRWREIERSSKWVAYERTTSGPVGEEWVSQPFHRALEPDAVRVAQLYLKARHMVGRATHGSRRRLATMRHRDGTRPPG